MTTRNAEHEVKEVDPGDEDASLDRILDEAEALDGIAAVGESGESGILRGDGEAETWRERVVAYLDAAADAAARTVADGEGV